MTENNMKSLLSKVHWGFRITSCWTPESTSSYELLIRTVFDVCADCTQSHTTQPIRQEPFPWRRLDRTKRFCAINDTLWRRWQLMCTFRTSVNTQQLRPAAENIGMQNAVNLFESQILLYCVLKERKWRNQNYCLLWCLPQESTTNDW